LLDTLVEYAQQQAKNNEVLDLVSCCFSFTFENIEEAKALRTQLNMTSARHHILNQTAEFETMLDEFISNNS